MGRRFNSEEHNLNDTHNSSQTGWEELAALSWKSELMRPEEDLNKIDEAIIRYTHCDLSRSAGYYAEVMKNRDGRLYPGTKCYMSPDFDSFQSEVYENWKRNIINMKAQDAVRLYGSGVAFDTLKKLHNYLTSGHDESTQIELLNSCFKDDDIGFNVAYDQLRYDRHSDPGWRYYSSRDEKVGLEEKMTVDGRLYLNIEPVLTFTVAREFVTACKEEGLPYEFKINNDPDRADAMVFYVDDVSVPKYSKILNNIISKNPDIKNNVGSPPLLTKELNQYIGYGEEQGTMSFNERRANQFKSAIETELATQRQDWMNGTVAANSQELARGLRMTPQYWDKFLPKLQSRLLH